MADGNKAGDGTQDDKTKALETELAATKKEMVGVQELLKKWSNEQGEVRKGQEKVESLTKTIDELQKTINDLKAGLEASGGKGKTEKTEQTVDDIESGLTDDQRKLTEVAFANASPEDKQKILSNDEFRKQFLLKAVESIPAIPDSPWKKSKTAKKGSDSSSDEDKRITALFNQAKENKGFIPSGSQSGRNTGGSSGGSGGSSKRVERASGGILDHLPSK